MGRIRRGKAETKIGSKYVEKAARRPFEFRDGDGVKDSGVNGRKRQGVVDRSRIQNPERVKSLFSTIWNICSITNGVIFFE